MAEVQQNNSSGGGKGKQKKQTLRVDFTPMVDMNMLLITFFMLATTLLKPQTMDLNMPANDKVEADQASKVRASDAITILIGADNTLYYYEGMIEGKETYDNPDFLKVSSYGADGIRQLLLRRNAEAYAEIKELEAQKKNFDITEEEYKEKRRAVLDEAAKTHKAPTVMVKPTDEASYKNVIDVMDEMLITNIGVYTLTEIQDGDRYLLYKKTDNGVYLTDQQRAEVAGGN